MGSRLGKLFVAGLPKQGIQVQREQRTRRKQRGSNPVLGSIDRYEAFGTAGNASKIQPLSLADMQARYAA